jgi:ferredoxin
MKSLPLIRRAIAATMLLAFLLLFARFDSFADLTNYLIRPQFAPAFLAGPMILVLAIIVLTLFTGRVYCSLVCPLGLIQDVFGRLSHWKSKANFRTLPDFFRAHMITAAIMFITASAGFISILVIAEPFSLAGRILSNLWQPINSRLMWLAGSAFSGVNWLNKARSNPIELETLLPIIIITVVLFMVVRKWGRVYCNLICPVGAILRLLSGLSLFQLRLSESQCTTCGQCIRSCKAGCIDINTKKIDFSRCVMCMNCVSACNFSAIEFASPYLEAKKDFSPQRRALITGVASVTAAKLFPNLVAGGSETRNRILPPGSGSVKDFARKCISCHLCISACPSSIISPSANGFVYGSLAQPELKFDHGMCEQTCNLCTGICPTGAISPVSLEEKKTLKIAEVEYIKSLCVVETDGKDCGACAEHCPTKAVRMVPYKNGLMIPEITPDICIGCGSCEHICPVRPNRAIIVNPIAEQKHIILPEAKPIEDAGPLEEFPF